MMSGCFAQKSPIRGINHWPANAGVAEIFKGRVSPCVRKSITAVSISKKPARKVWANCLPCSVSASPRPWRNTSDSPNSDSSARTCWAMAARVTFNCAAALLKLPKRELSPDARRACRDRSWLNCKTQLEPKPTYRKDYILGSTGVSSYNIYRER